jgi:hypothetical protein
MLVSQKLVDTVFCLSLESKYKAERVQLAQVALSSPGNRRHGRNMLCLPGRLPIRTAGARATEYLGLLFEHLERSLTPRREMEARYFQSDFPSFLIL